MQDQIEKIDTTPTRTYRATDRIMGAMLSLIKVLLPPSDFPQYTDTPPHDCMRSPHSLVGDVIHIARAARVKARGAIQNLCDAENTGLTLVVLTKVSG